MITPQHAGCTASPNLSHAGIDSLRSVVTYQPRTRYWAFQAHEMATFLGLALILAGPASGGRAGACPDKGRQARDIFGRYAGTEVIAQRTPGARVSRLSAVSKLQSKSSASAT